MANKQIQYSFSGASQDISKSKHPVEYYYEADHITLLSTDSQSTGSVANEKGNLKKLSIPSFTIEFDIKKISYNNSELFFKTEELKDQIFGNKPVVNTTYSLNKIIGHVEGKNEIYLFTTNAYNVDAIWKIGNVIEGFYKLELLYVRKLGFSINYPIQSIFNYENENIQKIYWVDGNAQMRHINTTNDLIKDVDKLIDIPSTSLNFVGQINFSQPDIQSIEGGGSHTSGMIQYAYNLFRLNSSQSKISPLSNLISLDKGDDLGGGELNEIVGSTPIIKINNLDPRYTHIKVYAIKYTSFNQIPSISLIDEREYSTDNIVVVDDGSIIDSLTLEEFLFLGSDPIIPKHIETKDGRLFPANITTKSFSLPDTFDFRAYSFGKDKITTDVLNEIISVNSDTDDAIGTGLRNIGNNYSLFRKHSAINPNYDKYKYKYNSNDLGGSGKLLSFNILQYTKAQIEFNGTNIKDYKFFKDNEIYRIGIKLYNELGQISDPNWIADYKMPEGNLKGLFNILKVDFTNEFVNLINEYNINNESAKIIGYKIIRADRTIRDRTILYQGPLTSMIFQLKDTEILKNEENPDWKNHVDNALKVPSYVTRHYKDYPNPDLFSNNADKHNVIRHNLKGNKSGAPLNNEIFTAVPRDDKLQYSWVFDKLMQLYSPEITFDESVNLGDGLKLKVKGAVNLTKAYSWLEERSIDTKKEKHGGKMEGGINYFLRQSNWIITEDNNLRDAARAAEGNNSVSGDENFIYGSGSDETTTFKLFHKEYGRYTESPTKYEVDIYGKPEVTERGQGDRDYNNDARYRYSNNLLSILSDADSSKDKQIAISSINSYGAKCLSIMLKDSRVIPTVSRPGINEITQLSNIMNNPQTSEDHLLLTEVIKPRYLHYLGNIYGGNSYANKQRTVYIEIGNYNTFNTSSTIIKSPGDTFVQNFKLMRIGKTDEEVYFNNVMQFTDVISFNVETTIDLKNRNDQSLGAWDQEFQPRFDNFHKYNRVYSQNANLVKSQAPDYKFNEVKKFKTRIQTTKLKIPNETIDSWTDILENETLDLDNKYGAINGLVSYKDKLYTFQDKGIALLSINPKVQVQSQDGIAIEMGSGGILDDYNYISTKSGSINKWGIVTGKKGIYYYDALNKGIGRVPDKIDFLLSDEKGMHSFYNNNYNYIQLSKDNPLLKQGVLFSNDNLNNNIYFTLLHRNNEINKQNPTASENANEFLLNSSTWCFNEIRDNFIDLKPGYADITRSMNIGDKLLVTKDNIDLYEQGAGKYNKFFEEYHPSSITLMVNPESQYDCVFDNIHYNSEIYLNDIDQPQKTLTNIRAWNEYQDSGKIPLIVGRNSNIRRKFREWQADIPRQGRDRIRNTWIYLKLELDNTSNYKMILHDIIIKYSI